jgi:hypothetical protein
MKSLPILAVLLAVFTAFSFCQDKVSRSKPASTKPEAFTNSKVPAKPKLTDKQKQGLRLLDSAVTEASALQPDMRAFIEWQISRGYEKYDLKKADELLQNAFAATMSISNAPQSANCMTDEPCRVKLTLQDEIVRELLKRAPEKANDLLLKVDAETKSRMNAELLETYIEKKQFGTAREILDSMAGADSYSYLEAASLMDALPESRRDERIAIFSQALANYQSFNTDQMPSDYDFPSMLVRFWRQLSPAMVMDAADTILTKTKEDDSGFSKLPMTVMTSSKGNIRFSSAYELRLFELMPIIRELDRVRAESLLRESNETRATLKDYPNGVLSIDKQFGKTPAEGDETFPEIVNFGPSFDAAEEQEQAYLFQQQARISAEVSRDPKQAIADVYSLPELTPNKHHPRVGSFLIIADRTVKKDPQACKVALSELRKADLSDKPDIAVSTLLQVADMYLQLNDSEDAMDVVRTALSKVDDLYSKDTDLDDPNLAFKGNWPSTQLWGRCLQFAAQISPQVLDGILGQIRDPEIVTYEKVMYANGLLGLSSGGVEIAQKHKDGAFHYYGSR